MSQDSCTVGLVPQSGNYHVEIRNHLSHDTILKVRCKSGGGDLGDHWVVNGQRFTVSFHNDKCVSAEYWCKLSWGSKSSHGGNYRFFSCEESFLKFCNFQDCSWKVRNDGIYLHDMHGLKDVKYYDWES
ncbi:uncharacterized protein Pyn_06994 [Prunus yedoensis var. nudiflora]|uniref:S-protein homolog n=1 Tax=Prunus yedoensis var. nudiflora TaxID=2094558 RepID=A0A314ZN33_PRUYE|nr:uncharacterized protein Pyn_06994 [Prunus yedoensis var. nudiflora]